ncbi:MAG: hypothetical protein DCC68_17190 [Planctomycetota bacterium]|nr:MAG: hypothetical protein DCC68_17190 [Planctomycetota bacterium]
MSRIAFHVWLYLGLMVGLLGLQLRMVETFVFTPESTKVLNDWVGPNESTPTGAIQRWAVNENLVQKQYRPPAWLGYALLSSGAVMFVHGLLLRNGKS